MSPMEQEFEQANRQLEQEIWETLDRCYYAGAKLDDVRFLAWQAGCVEWAPPTNVISMTR